MDSSPRKLIFYSTVGPDHDAGAWAPFRLAQRAAEAALDTEIYLAGPATGLIRRDVRDRLEGRPKESLEAVLSAGVPISVAPG
ncbi:MAG TPA: hypothetical protein VGR26_02025 [Acidimicrobiales bacterium]|nr:hypothetical protein [Acidimicrobiales bacterium]